MPQAGKIDVVVVYKIDRLTRSLADFARMIEIFERQKVSFVSVTQQFSTTTSMGRLMLNVLLSFAQFEREVTGERIRDKIAASKRKGMWMGGVPPLGYDVKDRRLVINPAEADLVQHIFRRFVDTGSTTRLVSELRLDGARTKAWTTQDGKTRSGKPLDKGNLYKMLHNRHYLGEISHGKTWYPAQHEAIVERSVWTAAHAILATNGRTRANQTRGKTPFLLRGLVVAEDGRAMTTSSNRNRFGRVYRYYIGIRETKECAGASGLPRIPAAELESAVMTHLRKIFGDAKLVPQDQRAALDGHRKARKAGQQLRQPDGESHAARARHRRGDPQRDAAAGNHAF